METRYLLFDLFDFDYCGTHSIRSLIEFTFYFISISQILDIPTTIIPILFYSFKISLIRFTYSLFT